MENATTSAVYNTTWKLSGNINGPAIAFFVTLQLLLALPSNLFIVVHSLSHMAIINDVRRLTSRSNGMPSKKIMESLRTFVVVETVLRRGRMFQGSDEV